ncbi:Putative adhesin [Candidatus Phycorickettsia trachydisci]|uniref:Adhesin n=1 Tax=Candidatus Phycorickettsia trachydisci TaxID=2115978 RepID=A0A2P1P722_9RICK|nr:outer membrane beta-barrel protein [Candidatus Phycorickettsia trachydisci]AVP87073.1 Putative adhesin [Candidatus Phycorickettsia trachydisci]
MTKIQKTFLALLATATAFSASAEGSKEGNFYLSGALGLSLQNKVSKPKADGYDIKVKTPGTAFEMGLGAGYYITDNFRTEIVFVKPFLNKSKIQNKVSGSTDNFKDVTSFKLRVNAVQIRGAFDLIDIYDLGKAYVTGGIGLSNVSGKAVDSDGELIGKFKNSYNFGWVIGAGAQFDVADNTKLGLEYNYSDHGKAKPKDKTLDYKTSVRGHSILAKLRFDI